MKPLNDYLQMNIFVPLDRYTCCNYLYINYSNKGNYFEYFFEKK